MWSTWQSEAKVTAPRAAPYDMANRGRGSSQRLLWPLSPQSSGNTHFNWAITNDPQMVLILLGNTFGCSLSALAKPRNNVLLCKRRSDSWQDEAWMCLLVLIFDRARTLASIHPKLFNYLLVNCWSTIAIRIFYAPTPKVLTICPESITELINFISRDVSTRS